MFLGYVGIFFNNVTINDFSFWTKRKKTPNNKTWIKYSRNNHTYTKDNVNILIETIVHDNYFEQINNIIKIKELNYLNYAKF